MVEALGIGTFFASLTPKGWIIIAFLTLVIASVTAVVFIADNRDKRMVETAQEGGSSTAVIAGQNQTLDQLGEANDAEQEIRNAGERSAARYDDCMRNNRREGACERFRPIAQ